MRWTRPRSFEYNLVVVGAGSAGLVSAYIAAAAKARVAIVVSDNLGGDCLNTGCVPSKALIHSAKVLKDGRGRPARARLRFVVLPAGPPEVALEGHWGAAAGSKAVVGRGHKESDPAV